MLDVVTVNCYPRVHALFINRNRGCGKVLVGKIADGNGDEIKVRAGLKPERRTTGRAKMEIGGVAAVGDMLVAFCVAIDRYCVHRKACLCGKSRPIALLAIVAMANRNAHGFACACDGKLATATGGDAGHAADLGPFVGVVVSHLAQRSTN